MLFYRGWEEESLPLPKLDVPGLALCVCALQVVAAIGNWGMGM